MYIIGFLKALLFNVYHMDYIRNILVDIWSKCIKYLLELKLQCSIMSVQYFISFQGHVWIQGLIGFLLVVSQLASWL
jgi:hypothetical protein